MPLKCQLLRPSCLVIGAEFHNAIGLNPIAVPTPSEKTSWMSLGLTLGIPPLSDTPSPWVGGGGGLVIKREHDTKFMRVLFSLGGLVPPVVVVPPVVDLGLAAVVIAVGQTKPV